MANAPTICRAVGRIATLSDPDKALMQEFRRWSLVNRPSSKFYYCHFSELSAYMESSGVNWTEFVGFERAVLTLLRAGANEAAYQLFRDTVIELVRAYWPNCDLPMWHAYYSDYQVPEVQPILRTPNTMISSLAGSVPE